MAGAFTGRARSIVAAAVLVASLPLMISIAAADNKTILGTASVIDGDTLEIHGQRIRLHGIDAPESRQTCARYSGEKWRCGQRAALALSDKIGRAGIACEERDIDRYGRIVAVCFKGSTDLNSWMVRQGWAVAYLRYSKDYEADEEKARAAGKNIWSGTFDLPWDWRKGQRSP